MKQPRKRRFLIFNPSLDISQYKVKTIKSNADWHWIRINNFGYSLRRTSIWRQSSFSVSLSISNYPSNVQIKELAVFVLSRQNIEARIINDLLGCFKMSLLLVLGGLKSKIMLKTFCLVFLGSPFNTLEIQWKRNYTNLYFSYDKC